MQTLVHQQLLLQVAYQIMLSTKELAFHVYQELLHVLHLFHHLVQQVLLLLVEFVLLALQQLQHVQLDVHLLLLKLL